MGSRSKINWPIEQIGLPSNSSETIGDFYSDEHMVNDGDDIFFVKPWVF